MEKVENFVPKKIGWGLIYGIVPCWIIEDTESTPTPISPMIMGGFVSEAILAVLAFLNNCLVALYNYFSNEDVEPMFVLWISPKTRKKIKKRFEHTKEF